MAMPGAGAGERAAARRVEKSKKPKPNDEIENTRRAGERRARADGAGPETRGRAWRSTLAPGPGERERGGVTVTAWQGAAARSTPHTGAHHRLLSRAPA